MKLDIKADEVTLFTDNPHDDTKIVYKGGRKLGNDILAAVSIKVGPVYINNAVLIAKCIAPDGKEALYALNEAGWDGEIWSADTQEAEDIIYAAAMSAYHEKVRIELKK